MVIGRLTNDLQISALENQALTIVHSIAVNNEAKNYRLSYDHLQLELGLQKSNIKVLLKRLVARGLLIRVERGKYKAGQLFQTAYDNYYSQIKENNQFNDSMRVIKTSRSRYGTGN